MSGKLIVFEGTDGSGKATQSRLLFERLQREGTDCQKLDFPRYGNPAAAPLEMYLRGAFGTHPDDVNAYAASTFFAVDRYASYKQDWGKYYEAGGLLIADRYTTSNAVHQAGKLPDGEREKYLDWLFGFEYGLLGLPEPSLVFYLDVPTELTERLMRERERAQRPTSTSRTRPTCAPAAKTRARSPSASPGSASTAQKMERCARSKIFTRRSIAS